jgi:hypothetical protein
MAFEINDKGQDETSGRAVQTPNPRRALDRRREARYPTHDPVEVRLLDGQEGFRVSGTAVDVSRNGLRIAVDTPFIKGSRLEIFLPPRAVIFGEVRHCERSSACYYVGVLVEDIYFAQPTRKQHIDDNQLGAYLAGKGLTVTEFIHFKNHLMACLSCQTRLTDAAELLPPMQRSSMPDQVKMYSKPSRR